jgi:hypothetical protein
LARLFVLLSVLAWTDSDAIGNSITSSKQSSSLALAARREWEMLAFIMEVMRSIISKAFPVSGTRSVFTLSNNSIRTI